MHLLIRPTGTRSPFLKARSMRLLMLPEGRMVVLVLASEAAAAETVVAIEETVAREVKAEVPDLLVETVKTALRHKMVASVEAAAVETVVARGETVAREEIIAVAAVVNAAAKEEVESSEEVSAEEVIADLTVKVQTATKTVVREEEVAATAVISEVPEEVVVVLNSSPMPTAELI